jgi:hypothetical protein
MRTTILLDDELGRRLRETARKRGQSLSAFLAEAGRAALDAGTTDEEPFELITRGGRGVLPGVDLDRTGDLLAAEDESCYGRQR